jgi:hypothetical protein
MPDTPLCASVQQHTLISGQDPLNERLDIASTSPAPPPWLLRASGGRGTLQVSPPGGAASCNIARWTGAVRSTPNPRPGRGDTATVSVVMSAEHLDDLRRRRAEQTAQGSTDDIVTTARLTTMRRRLNELEHTSENSTDGAEVMAAEEEAREIMDSLENVRDLRPSENGCGPGSQGQAHRLCRNLARLSPADRDRANRQLQQASSTDLLHT